MLHPRFSVVRKCLYLFGLAALTLAPSSAPRPIGFQPQRRAILSQDAAGSKANAVFAGGCFWGVEAVFRHVKGVKSATSGFAVGGPVDSVAGQPNRAQGGYAEAVRVVYDPEQIEYRQLLEVFFVVAHDPTQLNRQGPDVGAEYRSVVFVGDSLQRSATEAYLALLRSNNQFPRPIVTEVVSLRSFREAEDAHQDYVARHPREPYVMVNDAPKIADLQRKFPSLYHD